MSCVDWVRWRLRCAGDVRTREVGIAAITQKINPREVELIRRDYFANGGWETFLSYEDPAQGERLQRVPGVTRWQTS